ncbi:MAG: hypothetical protein AAF571_07080 [Verrucomicrobiota bacterium]
MPLQNDGSIPYGSRVITINLVTYVADNIEVQRPTKEILRTDEVDEPSGAVTYADFVTGSATLQMATSSTAMPPLGQTFTETFDTTVGSETFIIKNVSQPFEKGGERKVSIEFRKAYN